jgi:hypothetical protein
MRRYEGVALINQRVSAMGFLWHPTGLEAGIDGLIELRELRGVSLGFWFFPSGSDRSTLLVAEMIAHADTSAPRTVSVLVTTLKPFEPIAEPVSHLPVAKPDVQAGGVPFGTGAHRLRPQKCRTRYVGQLNFG